MQGTSTAPAQGFLEPYPLNLSSPLFEFCFDPPQYRIAVQMAHRIIARRSAQAGA